MTLETWNKLGPGDLIVHQESGQVCIVKESSQQPALVYLKGIGPVYSYANYGIAKFKKKKGKK